MRYLSAQIEAALVDGRWLGWARHANAMAQRLADGLTRLGVAEGMHPVEVNMLFLRLPERMILRGLRLRTDSNLGATADTIR